MLNLPLRAPVYCAPGSPLLKDYPMLCVILRVWEKWAAVVDSKLICVSTRKDRAVALWKAGDARMITVSIEKFAWLTFVDRRVEVIRAEELVGRGQIYLTARRTGANLSENDKDEIARAIQLVRSADWAQLPPKFQSYEDTSRAWSKARAIYMKAASAAITARTAALAVVSVANARREGDVRKAKAAKERAARLAGREKRLTQRADTARDAELRATAALHVATAEHLESKQWETRELVAYRSQGAVAQARAARRRALARGKKLDAKAEAQFEQSVEEADTLMRQLAQEDEASRCNRSLGPVWRPFIM